MIRLFSAFALLLVLLGLGVRAQAQGETPATYLPLLAAPAPTPTATVTPTATATPAPTAPTVTPTIGPTPEPFFGDCTSNPDPARAPQTPLRIAFIDELSENVFIRNVGAEPVDPTGWVICSIFGDEEFLRFTNSGPVAPGEGFSIVRPGNTWANATRDDGALYDASGRLISYYVDNE